MLIQTDFKFAHQEVIDFYASQKELCVPGMPVLDPSRLVDGQRKIEIIKQVPVTSAGRDFEFRATLLGAFDKGKAGTVIKMQDDLVDARSGELYARITGSLFYIGQGGWGGPRGQPEPSFSPPSDRSPDLMVTLTIGAQAAHLYRQALLRQIDNGFADIVPDSTATTTHCMQTPLLAKRSDTAGSSCTVYMPTAASHMSCYA